MSEVVLDASVVVKWYVPEVHTDRALQLLDDDHEFHVPDLIFPECANVLWKKERRGEIVEAEAQRVLDAIVNVPFHVYSTKPLIPAALNFALSAGRTVYDSLYFVLALGLGWPLLTADDRLVNSVRSLNPENPIHHISRWTP